MFKPLLGFVLVLGSLLVLVPKPTTGFTVKLKGDDTSFGEPIDVVNKETKTTKIPMKDDAFPDPNGKIVVENVPTSAEVNLDSLAESTGDAVNKKIKIPMKDDAFPDPNGKIIVENVPASAEVNLDQLAESTGDAVNKKIKIPMKDDAFPDPNGKENVPSDEVNLESLAKSMTDAQIDGFLTKYGYLGAPINGTVSEKERVNAVKEFQRFSRLHETGIVDTHTKVHMQKPRCGVADPVSSSKFAEFNAKGHNKWPKKHLTYKIVQFSAKVRRTIVREWVKKAFDMWADASQLEFREVLYGSSDLEVKFTPKVHGDGEPFDGKGGVLAHAFFPTNGQIHLEEAEDWTIESYKGTNLLFVLVHEIGHALGLGHTNVDQAIMEPVYTGYRPNLKLEKDDIDGIQFLYGKPKYKPPQPRPATRAPVTRAPVTRAPITRAPVNPSARVFPCPFYLGATMNVGGKTYGFRGFNRYEILANGKMTNGKSISTVYSKGPIMVAAAAHDDITRHTFLFSNRKVWRFTNNRLDRGFPMTINYYIRAAVVVYGQLIGFSFTHVHYLDQDTMIDYVDGDVRIKDEYPTITDSIRAAVTFGSGVIHVFSTNDVIQVDIFSGEIKSKKKCIRNYN